MWPTIYADLRCIQDPCYHGRGIGYHTSALLRTRKSSVLSGARMIGLVDPQLPPVPGQCLDLVDEISSSVNPTFNRERFVFMDGSPMTHDPRFSLRLENHPGFHGVAVLYDFIPWDWPGYLPTVAHRIEYVSKLARLKKFDSFFPISKYSATRLAELLCVHRARIVVTGACVRRSLYEAHERVANKGVSGRANPYFVTLGGDDRRKNTEVAVKAVRQLNLLYERRISLVVLGHYSEGYGYKGELLRLAGHSEGSGFLAFRPHVTDDELITIHAGAVAAIAPSRIEGFSLPIAEASLCGCPVVASTCAAQLELVTQAEALFDPDDSVTLAEKLETLLNDESARNSMAASQAHLAHQFHEESVGERFWTGVARAVDTPHVAAIPSINTTKPRFAFLSPFPPDSSSAASYTAMTMEAGRKIFSSDLYTNSLRPLTSGAGFRDAGLINLAPVVDKQCSSIISVLSGSAHDAGVLEIFERFGGACILHALPNLSSWLEKLGAPAFLRLATGVVGRTVSLEEATAWSKAPHPPSEFLSPILRRALPLLVHSEAQRVRLKKLYDVEAQVITSCPTIQFSDGDVSPEKRRLIRLRRGLDPDHFVVVSFGNPSRQNGLDAGIFAIELLRTWNIPAQLYLVGDVQSALSEINHFVTIYNVSRYVHYSDALASGDAFRDFLIGADAAIHVRGDESLENSATLHNCLGAGLACVTSANSAEVAGVSQHVAAVPKQFSPLLVAEQLAAVWDSRGHSASRQRRSAYLETHNFDFYARRLIELLKAA